MGMNHDRDREVAPTNIRFCRHLKIEPILIHLRQNVGQPQGISLRWVNAGDLYRLKISIALANHSLDLFAELVVGFPNPSFNGRGNLAPTIGHSLHVNVNRT